MNVHKQYTWLFAKHVFLILIYSFIALQALSCQPEQSTYEVRRDTDPIWIEIEVIEHDSIALQNAIEDVYLAVNQGAQTTNGRQIARIQIQLDPDLDLDTQGYRIQSTSSLALTISAPTPIAASYALYHILQDIGVRYIHPQHTVFPQSVITALPTYQQLEQTPRFAIRGFHEHTQHPIVMSDFLLRPDRDDFRQYVSHYLKWMVRNRQNALSFHMLNTVDLVAWIPYITDIIQEAHDYGIKMGLVTGFVDQQQNAYRLYKPSEMESAEVQITTKLDRILQAGFDFITFQIGTSEFTKPDESEMLSWLNLAVEHISIQFPTVQPYTWIHIACALRQEDGSPYYHLPLQADERLGAWVHTTMFYTLDHPAPVYDCEDFTHQKDFFQQAIDQRPLVFFPETAWWLGFDNNVPLVNPITGRSRQHDMEYLIDIGSVIGHINFTSGKEWTYWHYDHYLTQSTWQDISWNDYLAWLSPVYGDFGTLVVPLIQQWTDLQWQHLYQDHPEIYFYLAGELPQDELGEQAGILARRPKIAFQKIIAMTESDFTQWQTDDLQTLQSMLVAYQELFASIEDELSIELAENEIIQIDHTTTDVDQIESPFQQKLQQGLQRELYISYQLFILRIQHVIALYSGVVAVRQQDRTQADMYAMQAQMIGQQALELIQIQQSFYRYPDEVLIEEKPESLTAYPFGYLYETSTAYFWTRREEQLIQLIQDIFEAPPEEWGEDTQKVYQADGEDLELLLPNNALLENALGGFVPQVLTATATDSSTLPMRWAIAQDANRNTLPDADTVLWLSAEMLDADHNDPMSQQWLAEAESYQLVVRDASGVSIGQLSLSPVIVTFNVITDQTQGFITLDGMVSSAEMIELVISVAGIEADALAQLVKSIWALPLDQALPDTLPLKAKFTLTELIP